MYLRFYLIKHAVAHQGQPSLNTQDVFFFQYTYIYIYWFYVLIYQIRIQVILDFADTIIMYPKKAINRLLC